MANRTLTVGDGKTYTGGLEQALAAELASQSNLTTSGGICRIECYAMSGGDPTAVTAKAFTGSDANNYIHIIAIDRHAGIPNTTSYYHQAHGGTAGLILNVPYTRLEGVQIVAPVDHGHALSLTGANMTVEGCLFKGTDVAKHGLIHTGAGGSSAVKNCISWECGGNGFYTALDSGTTTYTNCTAVRCGRDGFKRDFGTMVAVGCLGYSNNQAASSYLDFQGTITMTDCASSDASAAGTDPHTNISDPFYSLSTDDYHLAAASAMIDAGADRSVTNPYDIDGAVTGARDDIGADEVMSAGTVVPQVFRLQRGFRN
jgi:hypothetical protein